MKKLNIFGPVTMRTGYGISVVNLTDALMKLDVQVALVPRNPCNEQEILTNPTLIEALRRGREEFDYHVHSINIWHASGLQSFTGKTRIGYPIFEGTRFRPEEMNHLVNLDRIFTTSPWAAEVVVNNLCEANAFSGGVHVIGLGHDPSIFYVGETPGIQGVKNFPSPRGINIGKWEERKGHAQLIRVLGRMRPEMTLFASWDNPFFPGWKSLCITLLHDNGWQQLGSAAHWRAGDCHLVLTSWAEGHANYAEFLRSLDFCIFPYKAEGWCLPLLECMACGLPYVATWYSAPKYYLQNEDGVCCGGVPITEWVSKPIFDQVHFPYGGYGDWAVPEDDDLEECIRYLLNNQDGLKSMGLSASKQASKFTWARAAQNIVEAIW